MNVFRQTEALVPCPFDPVHMILPHRMAQHIIKCRKNHLDKFREMKTCPFNANHLIAEKEFLSHLCECPDNEVVERDLFVHKKESTDYTEDDDLPAMFEIDNPAMTENWDHDYMCTPFSPLNTVMYKEFIRPPLPGLGKAGRKEWAEKEHLRVERIKKGLPIDDIVFPSVDGYESLHSSFAEVKKNITASNFGLIAPTKPATTNVPQPPPPTKPENLMLATNPLRRPKESAVANSRIAANIFGKKQGKPSVSDMKRIMQGISLDQVESASESSAFSFGPKKMSIGRGSFITKFDSLSFS